MEVGAIYEWFELQERKKSWKAAAFVALVTILPTIILLVVIILATSE